MFNYLVGFLSAAVVFTFLPGVAVWFNTQIKRAWAAINQPRGE